MLQRLGLIPFVFFVTACASANATRLRSFERDADEIRNTLRIPGMSAAVVENQRVLLMRGFGYADLDNKVPATPETDFPLMGWASRERVLPTAQ